MNNSIKSWKLLSANPLQIKNSDGHTFYDMYQIELTFYNGNKSNIKVFCEPNTILNLNNQRIKNAFISRIFGKNGLMEKQNRTNYIFLGRIEKNNDFSYKFNRFYQIPESNLNAQTFFDIEAYPIINEAFENLEKKQKNNTTKLNSNSKKYVISDIHGMYNAYMTAINLLKPNDTLYILGDVIDRGPDGIKILQDIMSRDKNQIKFILGNHEWQMIHVLEIFKKYNIPLNSNTSVYRKLGFAINEFYKTKYNMDQPKSKFETQTEYKDRQNYYSKSLESLNYQISNLLPKNIYNLSQDDLVSLYIWLDANNGSLTTFPDYLNLSSKEQEDIFSFLVNSHVVLKTNTENKKFLLVHSAPPNSKKIIEEFEKYPEASITYSRLSDYEREQQLPNWLESRDVVYPFVLWKNYGYTTIYGHTPKKDNIIKNPITGSIRIDTGCPCGGKLAMYCLDDDSCIYIDPEKSNIISKQFKESPNISLDSHIEQK